MIFLTGSLAICGLILTCIGSGLGIYNGLFHSTVTTQSFDLFIYIIGAMILLLTGFSPRRIIEPLVKPVLGLTSSNISERGLGLKSLSLSIDYVTYYKNMLRGITAPIHKMIEYPLIILFILVGSIALISSSDYLTMFLAIELQSYGLYILVALHRNSEWSIVAGLTYFLLGGLASCFILLGSSFLYASSGVTFFDGMYIFEKMAIICVESRLIIKVLQKKPLLLSMGLLILAVGYLFKVSAAPFHSWSPDRGPGKSSILGNKLPNSENTLELLVPSHNWKIVGGWINYSGKVTSQKASEKNVGDCGSKSVESSTVKEQRVDGSWRVVSTPRLRYTLMGFERNYPVKNHSNLIIQRRLYSHHSSKYEPAKAQPESKISGFTDGESFEALALPNTQTTLKEPWFITGFTDAEGCFLIIVRKAPKNKLGWQLELAFIINLHKKEVELLKRIQSYFGGAGRIGKERNGCCDFTVSSLDQILAEIIPQFDKYPLKSQKFADYLLFREVAMMMKRREHLTASGLQKIINIRATINRGLTPVLKEAFPNSVAVPRPQLLNLHSIPSGKGEATPDTQDKNTTVLEACRVENQSTLALHPSWVAGFTSGDGTFIVSIRASKTLKVGARVSIIFAITQHIRDELLLKSLVNFFLCGQAYSYESHTEFKSQSFIDNYEKILPFFRKYPILGVKSRDFDDWDKVAEMIRTKAHLTNEGLDQIRQIKAGMNLRRSIE